MSEWSQYRWLCLEPLDAWFFRDGRPSNRDEDQSDLVSLFPPLPPTVVGALRGALARERGWNGRGSWAGNADMVDVLGNGYDDLGSLRFLGPLLMRDGSILWPMPRHVVGRIADGPDGAGPGGRRFEARALLAPSETPVETDAGRIHLPALLDGVAEGEVPQAPDKVYVTTAGLEQIVQGKLPDPATSMHLDDLVQYEPRVGIARDQATGTTGEGAMYSPHYVRLRRGVRLAVAVAGLPPDWPIPDVLPLGGESRMAGVTLLQPDRSPRLPSARPGEGRPVALALGPARFAVPWWGAGPGQAASGLHPSLTGDVVTVCMDRPTRVGGWNSLDRAPLDLEPLAGPGTVWWLETHQGAGGLVQIGSRTEYGYGLALVTEAA